MRELRELFTATNAIGKNVRKNIRRVNNLFNFASLQIKLTPPNIRGGQGIFRTCDIITHRISILHSAPSKSHLYSQLYIYDGVEAVNQ